jgi:hypothetical protein
MCACVMTPAPQPDPPVTVTGTSGSIATLAWQVAAKEGQLEKVQDELHQVRPHAYGVSQRRGVWQHTSLHWWQQQQQQQQQVLLGPAHTLHKHTNTTQHDDTPIARWWMRSSRCRSSRAWRSTPSCPSRARQQS